MRPPADTPCGSCPYRLTIAPGIWAPEEYDKLRAYDLPTGEQPTRLFLCHQNDGDSAGRRVCAGWVGCHGGENLLGPRIALHEGRISAETYRAIADYLPTVPLAASGAAAADHGTFGRPTPRTQQAIEKISRVRGDLIN